MIDPMVARIQEDEIAVRSGKRKRARARKYQYHRPCPWKGTKWKCVICQGKKQ